MMCHKGVGEERQMMSNETERYTVETIQNYDDVSEELDGREVTLVYDSVYSDGNVTFTGKLNVWSSAGFAVMQEDDGRKIKYGSVRSATGTRVGEFVRLDVHPSDSEDTEGADSDDGVNEPEPAEMTTEEIREERQRHIIGYALDPDVENRTRHSQRAHKLESELEQRGDAYTDADKIIAWANDEREDIPAPSDDSDGEDSEVETDGGEDMAEDTERVDADSLFSDVDEGDRILFGDREEPVTVYRHVTEDDHTGQVISMKRVTEEHAEQTAWEVEHGHAGNDALRAGDLITMEHTSDEYLIARGPRGGCYLLKQWWDESGGRWTASIALFRRAREDTEVWTWENTVNLEIVGCEDVNREEFDAGGDWTRHTDVQGEDVTVWTDAKDGEVWAHSEDLTGTEDSEPSDTGADAWEQLETVSEGDTISVNGVTVTVRDVSDEYAGTLADGVTLTLDTEDGEELKVRTFAVKGYAALIGPDRDGEDVTDVTLAPSEDTDSEDADAATDGGEEQRVMTDGGEDVTEGEDSATERLRRKLAERSDEHPDTPGEISDEDVFQAVRHDVTSSDGHTIIRFQTDRSDGSVRFIPSEESLFRDYYSPTQILMEHFGLTEGVRDALDYLQDAADLRRASDGRTGVFHVDEDTGRVTEVEINTHILGNANKPVVTDRMVALANGEDADTEDDRDDGGDTEGADDDVTVEDKLTRIQRGDYPEIVTTRGDFSGEITEVSEDKIRMEPRDGITEWVDIDLSEPFQVWRCEWDDTREEYLDERAGTVTAVHIPETDGGVEPESEGANPGDDADSTATPDADDVADARHVLAKRDSDSERVRSDLIPSVLSLISADTIDDVPHYGELLSHEGERPGKHVTTAALAHWFAEYVSEDADPAVGDFSEWLDRHDTTDTYDVKTVRVHEPERGRYVYVMVTRLDGRNHVIGETGFTGMYFQFSVMSQSEDFRLTRLGSYELKRDHPVDWFADTNAYRLIRGLDDGVVDWTALADEDRLTPEDVDALLGGGGDE